MLLVLIQTSRPDTKPDGKWEKALVWKAQISDYTGMDDLATEMKLYLGLKLIEDYE